MLPNNSFKFSFFCLVFILSCSSNKEENENVITSQPVAKVKITDTSNFANNINAYDSKVGALGVFEVPEMLVLSLLDSAKKQDLPERMVKNYSILEKDLNAVAAEMNGPIGMISYNNNPDNYIFESLICIKQIPKKQPANSKIVIPSGTELINVIGDMAGVLPLTK